MPAVYTIFFNITCLHHKQAPHICSIYRIHNLHKTEPITQWVQRGKVVKFQYLVYLFITVSKFITWFSYFSAEIITISSSESSTDSNEYTNSWGNYFPKWYGGSCLTKEAARKKKHDVKETTSKGAKEANVTTAKGKGTKPKETSAKGKGKKKVG